MDESSGADLSDLLRALPGGSPEAVRAFDLKTYPLIVAYVQKRSTFLASDAAHTLGVEGLNVSKVSASDLDSLARDVANTALGRLHANAGRFDPARGTATAFVFRAAGFAYVDEARKLAGGRGAIRTVTTDPAELPASGGPQPVDPAEALIARERLDRALSSLTSEERAVFLDARQQKLSREAIAVIRYPHLGPAGADEVAKVLRRATRAVAREASRYETEAADDERRAMGG